MSSTYVATLRGNCLEWQEAVPEELAEDKALTVSVTILNHAPSAGERQDQGERMAAALSELAALAAEGLAQKMPDPSAWQRDTRTDRPLPDREP